MRMKRLLVIVAVLLLAAATFGHDLDFSAIRIVVRPKDTLVSVTAARSKLAGALLPARLRLTIDGKPFVPVEARAIEDAKNDLVTWQATGAHGHAYAVGQRLFPEDGLSKTLITVTREGRLSEEALLDAGHPAWNVRDEGSGRFLPMGVFHVLSGLDHVLFVVGLVLLGGRLKSLLKTISAFTLAHSLTLTIAATGLWTPPSRVIEPLIALSILAVAIENLRTKKGEAAPDRRPLVAFGFGLVHGFGFAGALGGVGLNGLALAAALLLFNLGVEIGQAVVVLATVPLIKAFERRRAETWQTVARFGSIALGLVSVVWFVQRAAGV